MDTTNRIYQKCLPHNNQKKKKEEIKINVTFSFRVENHPLKYIHQAKEKVSLKSMALKSTFRSHESVFVSSTYKYFVLQESKDEIYRINLFRKKNEKEKLKLR